MMNICRRQPKRLTSWSAPRDWDDDWILDNDDGGFRHDDADCLWWEVVSNAVYDAARGVVMMMVD